MSEIQILRGQGPYEKQTGTTNVVRPLVLAAVYAGVILFIYAPAVYVEAVLVGVLFGPALAALGLRLLVAVSFNGGLTIRRKLATDGQRLIAVLFVAVGALFIYLRVIPHGWPWSWATGDGRLWIGTPWAGFGIPAAWQAARYGLALALPLALIPAGIVLLARILMEIGYPNLADSVRAVAGQLISRRWIGYPQPGDPQPEAQPGSNKPREAGDL